MRYQLLIILLLAAFAAACGPEVKPPANEVVKPAANAVNPGPEITPKAVKPDNTTVENGTVIEAIYTDLAENKCEDTDKDEAEEWSVQSCKGVGGYSLIVSEGDLRQTIDVVAPDGSEFELNLWQVVSSGFSTVGDKAEWRVVKEGGKVKPVALIVRYNVNEDPEDTDKITSYLSVSKITDKTACVTDIVKPVKNANAKARQLADNSSEKPCLGPQTPSG